MSETRQPTPAEYRKHRVGEAKVAQTKEEAHQLLEKLRGQHIKVGITNNPTHQDIIQTMQQGKEITFTFGFRNFSPWMLSTFSVSTPDQLVFAGDMVCIMQTAVTAEARSLTVPLDQYWVEPSGRSIICHNHPRGPNTFEEADQAILARSPDLIHGVMTTKDHQIFSMTVYDPLTQRIEADHFSFSFVAGQYGQAGDSNLQRYK